MERDHTLKPSRRQFVSAALVGLAPKTDRTITGAFVNESVEQGHRLRSRGPFRAPAKQERIPLAIVGGGIAGLSAAWWLEKRGFRDFVLLEMEKQPGGVARWGENEITAFPWGAHYVPVPGPKSALIRDLLADLGVLADGKWDERHLCFSPQERLFLHGRWQEGIEPEVGATRHDHEQYRRFEQVIAEARASGNFTIPMERAGHVPDPALDRLPMSEWMRQHGFDSPYLHWYVNYACRDDYGALAEDTSAWAGIHYFASREPDEKGPLTWPEGNGWIVRKLVARLAPHLRTGVPVYRVVRDGSRVRVRTETVEYIADAVIFAAPTFLTPYVCEEAPLVSHFEYSPWLTANLVLDHAPPERANTELAWDNVIYESPALGYVVATHQSLRSFEDRTVWTFYWALANGPAAHNRAFLLSANWSYWKEAILNDLSRAHLGIRQCVSHIDIMRLGHAMIRPRPGFLSSEERRRAAAHPGPIFFAHSDLSGFSIIEEAQYRGVVAAGRALAQLGGRRAGDAGALSEHFDGRVG